MTDVIAKYCQSKQSASNVGYLKAATGGNDPSISKSMRYSQYVRNTKSKSIIIQKPPVPVAEPVKVLTQVITRPYGVGFLAQKSTISPGHLMMPIYNPNQRS